MNAPDLRDWFEDIEKQRHAATLGMWLFLTSEILLFGGLFALYAAYRVEYTHDFTAAATHSRVAIGTVNTAVLLTSSFCVAWGARAVRGGARTTALVSIAATMLLGLVFLVLKGIEYRSHIIEGALPGAAYSLHELPSHGSNLFFTLYWLMTGLHSLHVLGGLIALTIVWWMVRNETIGHATPTALENVALYWHLVDVVWVFLWPLFYLVH